MQDAEEQHPDDAVVDLEGSDAGLTDEADSEDDAEPIADLFQYSNMPVDGQQGVICLKRALNNILYVYAGCNSAASPATFDAAARTLNQRLLEVEEVPPEQYADKQ